MGERSRGGGWRRRRSAANGVDTVFTLVGRTRDADLRGLPPRGRARRRRPPRAVGRPRGRGMGPGAPRVRRRGRHGRPGRDRHRHGRRELLRRTGAARRDRRRAAARAGGAGRAAGVRPALAVQADHEVGGGLPDDRADPRVRRDRVPPRARPAARPGVPRAADGRPLRRRRRGAPGRAVPLRGARAFGDPERDRRAADLLSNAERPAIDRRQRDLVGRRAEAARRARRARPAPRLPQRLGPRRAAARPPALLPALARSGRRGGGRRLRDRHAARLPAQVRALHADRSSSTCTATRPSSAATARPTWASSATAPPCSERSPTASEPPRRRRLARAPARRGGGVVGRAPCRDRVRQRPAQPLPPRRASSTACSTRARS